MAQPKKKKFPVIAFAVTMVFVLILCQYTAAHISGWINAGGGDLLNLDTLPIYFVEHPFDMISFHALVYASMYLIVPPMVALVFVLVCFKPEPPVAEMKGMEHGSNDFMTPTELSEFVRTRTTVDFPYREDCTVAEKCMYGKAVKTDKNRKKNKNKDS